MEDGQVNILLVEDDEVDVRAIKRAFDKEKISNPIARAKNGFEALEILRGGDGLDPLGRPYLLLHLRRRFEAEISECGNNEGTNF